MLFIAFCVVAVYCSVEICGLLHFVMADGVTRLTVTEKHCQTDPKTERTVCSVHASVAQMVPKSLSSCEYLWTAGAVVVMDAFPDTTTIIGNASSYL